MLNYSEKKKKRKEKKRKEEEGKRNRGANIDLHVRLKFFCCKTIRLLRNRNSSMLKVLRKNDKNNWNRSIWLIKNVGR